MHRLRDVAPLLACLSVAALLAIPAAHAQEVVLDLPHDYPPAGQRLRELADIAGLQFGYAARTQFNEEEHAARYDAIVRNEFNILTPENANKWIYIHPEQDTYSFESMDGLVAFGEETGQAIHGHPLLWHQLNPAWIESLPADQVGAALDDHIATVAGRYAGRIDAWDVVNEALEDTELGGGYRQNLWFNALGDAYIARAFEQARIADPSATLIYNDYGVGWLSPKSDAMYSMIADLLEQGVPIDAVGFQMHVTTAFDALEDFSTNMQRFADLGVDIYITELDVQIADQVPTDEQRESEYALQADVYQQVLERCLAQPRCVALQVWGINDYYSWLPWFDPLPFDNQYNAKPAYFGLQRGFSTTVVDAELPSAASGWSMASGAATVNAGGDTSLSPMLAFGNVDFRAAYRSVTLRYRNAGAGPASIALVKDAVNGTLIADVELPVSGTEFREISVDITDVNSIGDLYLIAESATDGLALDYLIFNAPRYSLQALPVDLPAFSGETVVSPSEESDDTGQDTNGSQGSSGGGGALGPAWLLLAAGLGLRISGRRERNRCRRHRPRQG